MCLRTNISQKVNSNISFLSFSHQLVEYTFTSPKLHVAEREWRWLYLILFSLACTLVINLRCMVLYGCFARSSFLQKKKCYAKNISHSKYRYYLSWFSFFLYFLSFILHQVLLVACTQSNHEIKTFWQINFRFSFINGFDAWLNPISQQFCK